MKRSAQATLVVVGSADQQLEEMLRPGGAHLTAMSLDNFSALGHPHSPQPDVILVDVRQQSVLPPALETLKRHHPLTGVVIIASRLDPALMLDAMRAGVNEWVTEPVTPTALTAAVQRALARRETMPAIAQVLAFVGAKGGVGATTVAVHVATALAKAAPGKCLLIDLHLAHGDAALFLGVEPKFAAI